MDPTLYLALRLLKLLSAGLFAAGTLGAALPAEMPLATRRRFLVLMAGPGFGLSWALGFVLAGVTRRSYLSSWVLISLPVSLLALHFALYAAGREGRTSGRAFAALLATLTGLFALMTFKPWA